MLDKTVKILLVEDNSGDALLIREMLARTVGGKFEMEWVTRLADGLERLDRGGIDVVLLDLGLPDSQGLDTFTRAYAHSPQVPFVVLTGLADETVGFTAVRQGAQDYLIKGEVDGKLLLRAIRYATERKGVEEALRQAHDKLVQANWQLNLEVEERRRAQESAECERQKLFSVLNTLPAFVHLKGADFTIQFVNHRFTELFGEPRNRHCYEVLKGRSEPCEDCRALEVLKNKAPQKFEWTSSLNARTYEVYNYPFCVEDDLLILTLGIDITERKRMEGALRESEEKYRRLVNQVPAVVFKGYEDWSVDFFDEKIEALTGHSKEEFDSRRLKWCDVILPEDLDYAIRIFIDALKSDGSFVREHRIRRKDGEIRWIQCRGQILYDAAGKIDYVSGMTFDITPFKKAEEALRQSEEKYRLLVNQIPAVVFKGYADWSVDFFDNKIEALTGYSKEEFDSRQIKWCELILPEDLEQAKGRFINGIKTGGAYGREYRIRKKDGGIVWIQAMGQIFYDAEAKLDYVSGVFFDITERKRAEERLREQMQFSATLLETIPAPVFYKDASGRYLGCNQALEEFLGKPREQIIGKDAHDMGPREIADKYAAMDQALFEQPGRQMYEWKVRAADGLEREVIFNKATFSDASGKVAGLIGVILDITARNRAEAEIKRNEARLAGLLRISQYSPTSIQELLDYALDEAITLTGSKIGYIYFYDETTQQFALNTWSKEVMQVCTVAEPRSIYQLEKTGIWGEAVRQARPIMVNDFQAPHPLKKGYPEGHTPLYKYLTIPVISDNRIVAVVGVANKANDYDDADVRQLTLMMDTVWKIVERQRAEEDLRKSQERYRLLVDQIPATVFKGYPDWSVDFFDDKVEELTGYPKADFDSRKVKWCDLIPEEDFDYAQRVFIEALKTDKSYVREHRIRRKDGEIRWVQCRGQIFCDADGKVIHSSGVSFDVTKHKQTEEALRESEERFRTIFKDAAIGISLTDLEGRIINCNPAMQKMMGCAPDEIIGKTFMEITHPGDREKSLELFHDLLGGRIEHYQLEKRYLRADGQYLWARITVSSVKESESAPPYNIAMIEDITGRKEAEDSIRHLTHELMRAQEQEKHKISLELHDTVAQELASLKIGLENLRDNSGGMPDEKVSSEVTVLLGILQQPLNSIRNLSYDLRPPDLEHFGLVQAIQMHCEEVAARTGLRIDFKAAGIEGSHLDYEAAINLYRIIQEGMANVWRHARAENVSIRLVASYPKIILRLEDDGQGFNVAEQAASNQQECRLGLLGMKERVAFLGGEMHLESQLKKGTKIIIEIPWSREGHGAKEEDSYS